MCVGERERARERVEETGVRQRTKGGREGESVCV